MAADYSHLRIKNPNISEDFSVQMVDGLEYQWIHTNRYSGNGSARAISIFIFCWKLWFYAQKIVNDFHPDIVITSSTYPLDTYAGQKIALLAKAKLIHEGHDLWPLTLIEIGGMSVFHPFVILMGRAEKSAYRYSSQVVSVLPFSYKYMMKHGLQNKDKFHYIPNGIVKEDWTNMVFEPLPKLYTDTIERIKKTGSFIIMYIGGHAISNSLDILIDSAEKLKNEKVVFILVGNGSEKERLISRKHQEMCENVLFLPPVSKKMVPVILSQADALYIGAKNSTLYKYGVSVNKVYDYMMSGKPIIYGVEAANNEVEEAQCGISIRPDDVNALVTAVLQLFNMDQLKRDRLGSNGRQWVLNHCEYGVLAEKFSQLF